LQAKLAGLASIQAALGNLVAGGIAPLRRVVQRLAWSGVGLSSILATRFITAGVDMFSICSNPQIRGRRLPPTAKSRGLQARKTM
jgi:hypothetical protein